MPYPLPQKHHLDRHADELVQLSDGENDDLLNTHAVACWLGVSTAWLEIGRSKQFGPPYIRISTRRIRYRRSDVLAWLQSRLHHSTSEYIQSKHIDGAGVFRAPGREPRIRVTEP